MIRSRRRGMMLAELLLLLPVIGAIITTGFLLTTQITRFERSEGVLINDGGAVLDLVRRVQSDARSARQAEVGRDETGTTLRLMSGTRSVVYHSSPEQITRIEQGDATPPIRYGWTLEQTRVDFRIEPITGSPGMVWISVVTAAAIAREPVTEWRTAAAAPLANPLFGQPATQPETMPAASTSTATAGDAP